jgi:hypothetical protein
MGKLAMPWMAMLTMRHEIDGHAALCALAQRGSDS